MFTKVTGLTITHIKQAKNYELTGCDSIEKPYLNSLLGQHLASNLCKTLSKCDVLMNGEFDMEKILQVNVLRFLMRSFAMPNQWVWYDVVSHKICR